MATPPDHTWSGTTPPNTSKARRATAPSHPSHPSRATLTTRAWGEGSWAAQVGKEILSNDRYNTFPHLKIAGQNLSACDGCKIDAYTPGQVNLFGYLGDYMVADHWEETLSKLFECL